ncbi:putative transposase [Xanthomonas arboricola]|uniref:transposase n=1 Tax=Xanthomonas cannabis TaxID=1885674 RepID=UPI00161668A1|nr:transposase [Xanthomonas cannabis]MBB3801303.1 putative transposase [Xanthomonas cannabis]
MSRLTRIDLTDIPQHIVQRGNNRLPCFLDDGDQPGYLHLLHEALQATGRKLHAYVLMENHVHLLVTPAAAGRIGQLMQRLGRNYVALFNGRHGRTGTLWEGRYKACLVNSADYVLSCYRYIELNPVRARLTHDPASYRWSSCPANLGQRRHSALTPHPCWLALGNDPIERCNAYRALLDEALPDELLASIRLHLKQQRALGYDAFRAMVQAETRRFAGVRPAHRPCNPSAVDK